MDLEPTVTEARLFVGCLCVYWALGAVLYANGGSAWGVLTLPLVVVPFVVVARVLARSSGRSVREHLGWRVPSRGDWHLGVLFLVTLFSPRWWKAVVRTTGWPMPLVTLALAGTLAVALVSGYLGG